MNRRTLWVVLVGLLIARAATAQEAASPPDRAAVAKALARSLVRVEYTLRYDKGEEPEAAGWTIARCPVHRYAGFSLGESIRQERPAEMPGYLLSPTRVITVDPMIHPRFLKGIAVRYGDQVVKAHPAVYPKTENGVILELEQPLADAEPLAFDAKEEPPYLALSHFRAEGMWTTLVDPLPTGLWTTETGDRFRQVPVGCLIVGRRGVPVGVSMNGRLAADDSWKGPPLEWPAFSAEEVSRRLAAVRETADGGLLRVSLYFRSPKRKTRAYWRDSGDGQSATERNVLGVLTEERTVVVLANLKPKKTALLKRIVVHPAEGEGVPATFAHTLSDYGCFLATLQKPLPGAIELTREPIVNYRDLVLLSAEVRLQGEQRIIYLIRRRIPGFETGWKRQTYPDLPGSDEDVFLFHPEGTLVALPVARREKVSLEERWRSDAVVLTPAVYLRDVLARVERHVDPSNVPLSEEEEERLAWMGVELQPLNPQLARANKVADLTRDGETGALVSYVYPDSPAMKAGIEPGFILLRLCVEGHPKPLEIDLEDSGGEGFPWDQLDQVPEQYFDRLPQPWPSAENDFTRALTDLGFGKRYEAEFFAEGKVIRKGFEVVQGPPHYGAAPRHKSEAVGLTVRDMTYEVRRYFQKAADEPGVIVSKVEPGSKASVAGVKPYEIITHVNDKPLMTVKDFEKLIGGQVELRLSVKRMTRGRLVKIKMSPAPKAPSEGDKKQSAADPPEPAGKNRTED